MGTRSQRVRSALASPRAESVAGGLLIAFLTVALVSVVGVQWPRGDSSAAIPVIVVFLLLALAAGAAAVTLLQRWHPPFLDRFRDRYRTWHWAFTAMVVPLGLLFLLGGAPSFAAEYLCDRGDGVVVQTSWTEQDVDRGSLSGVYTYDGETYDVSIADDEEMVRQVAPEQPPTSFNPYYVRSYRVPWPGARLVCGTTQSPDHGDVIAIAILGFVSSVVTLAALASLVGRRRRTDESGAAPKSAPA